MNDELVYLLYKDTLNSVDSLKRDTVNQFLTKEEALGQYILYSSILEEIEPQRFLYLAVPIVIFRDLFSETICQLLLKKTLVRLIVFDPQKKELSEWIH